MNKTTFSKLTFKTRPEMRVILKKRNNWKESYEIKPNDNKLSESHVSSSSLNN